MRRIRKRSALHHLLLALIPYSRQNLMLSFSPNRFFNQLEKSSRFNQKALKEARRRGIDKGYIKNENDFLKLTESGLKIIQPFAASKIKNGKLMVIFDIPEERAAVRKKFRLLLRQWGFEQVQKSVWMTELNHTASIEQAIYELSIADFVQLYECSKVRLKISQQ